MQLSTQQKLDALSDEKVMIYFGDFIDDIQFAKNEKNQNYTLNSVGSLRDETLEVLKSVHDEKVSELTHAGSTLLDMGLILRDIKWRNKDAVNEAYDEQHHDAYAYRGLSQSQFA